MCIRDRFYYVRGLGRLETLEDIGNVVLAVNNGTPVLLKNVGRVIIGIAPRLGEFGYEKQDDCVEGVILLRTGDKTQDVLKRVEAKTRQLNDQILPKDVKVVPFYDRTDLIKLTTKVVEQNLLRGMLLVIVILIFFLYDFRAGLIVAVTIPLALLFAFICLDLQKASANLLSIGAEFMPQLDEGALWVRATMPYTISYDESAKITPQIRAVLKSFPEVTTVASELARPDDGTDSTGFFNVEFYVGLKPYSEWAGAYRTKAALIEAINQKLASFPGIIFNYTQPAEDAVDEAESGLKSALAVKVFGSDLDTLEQKGLSLIHI